MCAPRDQVGLLKGLPRNKRASAIASQARNIPSD
jgi:hypothetical protein